MLPTATCCLGLKRCDMVQLTRNGLGEATIVLTKNVLPLLLSWLRVSLA